MRKIYLAILAMMILLVTGCAQTGVQDTDADNETSETNPEQTQVSQEQQDAEQNTDHEVILAQNGIDPDTLQINKGDTVVWVNKNRANHRLLSESGYIHSGNLSGEQAYSKDFAQAGTYEYRDTVSGASATIVVE